MIIQTPNLHFFSTGAAEGTTRLNSLDGALLAAGAGNVSLMKLNAVIPPGNRLAEPCPLPPGALVPAAYAAITSEIPGEIISAGVAVAYPADENLCGVVMEYSSPGHKEDIEAIVRRMAEEGMKMRGAAVKEIRSIAVQHRVQKTGTAFAAVVLWTENSE